MAKVWRRWEEERKRGRWMQTASVGVSRGQAFGREGGLASRVLGLLEVDNTTCSSQLKNTAVLWDLIWHGTLLKADTHKRRRKPSHLVALADCTRGYLTHIQLHKILIIEINIINCDRGACLYSLCTGMHVWRHKPCGAAVPYTYQMTQCIHIKHNEIISEDLHSDAHVWWSCALSISTVCTLVIPQCGFVNIQRPGRLIKWRY